MLNIMLCGESDTQVVADRFAEVTQELGGEAWHFLSGQMRYTNTATASWKTNSRLTVAMADLCVFVMIRNRGEITWGTELQAALAQGTPFLLLCLDDTYAAYLERRRTQLIDQEDPALRSLVETLTQLETERELTVVQFGFDTFVDIYRREAARVFAAGLSALGFRARRDALVRLLDRPERLTELELLDAEKLAIDEFEDKGPRKLAVMALVQRRAATPPTATALVHSREQGIQRLAIANLRDLYTVRPPEPEFLEDCVAVANESDDTGVSRRLVRELFELGVAPALEALQALDLTDVGARRRLATELERHERPIIEGGLVAEAAVLLDRCLRNPAEEGWKARCRALLGRIQGVESAATVTQPADDREE